MIRPCNYFTITNLDNPQFHKIVGNFITRRIIRPCTGNYFTNADLADPQSYKIIGNLLNLSDYLKELVIHLLTNLVHS